MHIKFGKVQKSAFKHIEMRAQSPTGVVTPCVCLEAQSSEDKRAYIWFDVNHKDRFMIIDCGEKMTEFYTEEKESLYLGTVLSTCFTADDTSTYKGLAYTLKFLYKCFKEALESFDYEIYNVVLDEYLRKDRSFKEKFIALLLSVTTQTKDVDYSYLATITDFE